MKDGVIVPLDSEKGVFTSCIHLLDELSIQVLSQEHLKSTPGIAGIRERTSPLTGISTAIGRDVQVLASSAERAISLGKSDVLRDRFVSRQHIMSGDFHLKPQSMLTVEEDERLGRKETLVLLGEARAQDVWLIFQFFRNTVQPVKHFAYLYAGC